MYLDTPGGRTLNELADENTTLYATPDGSPSWDGSNHVLAWTISTQEPEGLHVSIDISSEEDTWNARSLVLDAIQRSELARCPICGKVDFEENMYGVEVGPSNLLYNLHEMCTPLYVDEPQALGYIADHYHEVPGVWGWEVTGMFVAIGDVRAIQQYLDENDIPYHTL